MYRDLVERAWYIMGPEDFAASESKLGWPFILIAREETLDFNPVETWYHVIEHEYVHMAAAANVALDGESIAVLMRGPDGSFTHRARFHEVCADYYPRDDAGAHRPVALFYGAIERMAELLRALESYEAEQLAFQAQAGYTVLTITGIPVVDAACVWDREAMAVVQELYDAKEGAGAFDILFPAY
jgi:hypothetical protein